MPSNLTPAQRERIIQSTAPASTLPDFPVMPESVPLALERLSPEAASDLRQWTREIRDAWNLLRKSVS